MQPIVIARAPLSINLGEHEIGAPDSRRAQRLVLRAAVDHYVYTIVTYGPGDDVQIVWAGCPSGSCHQCSGDSATVSDLGLPEAISRHFNLRSGLTVFLAPQSTPCGGLGVSGSLAVSMIKALAFCSGIDLDALEVADLACQVREQLPGVLPTDMSLYAAAYGGLSSVALGARHTTAEPLSVSAEVWQLLTDSFLLFRPRNGQVYAPAAQEAVDSGRCEAPIAPAIKGSGEWAQEIRLAFQRGDLDAIGCLLHHAWLDEHQRCGRPLDAFVDQCYLVALENGALGGHTGRTAEHPFLGVFCKSEDQPDVTAALAELGMDRWPLRLISDGVEVLEAMPRSWSKMTAASSLLLSMKP